MRDSFRVHLVRRGFTVAIGLLFVVRGIQVQCLSPPLEGPDEYQHIAYMVYLREAAQRTDFRASRCSPVAVPRSCRNPHCHHDWEQTGRLGCLKYGDFYERDPQQTGNPTIQLYEAQQPPLSYLLFSNLFTRLWEGFGFRTAVYTLRCVNIGLARPRWDCS